MVAAPGIRGIKVSIWSEGKELPEYNDSTLENTSRLAQRYVQCEAGKHFEVRLDYGLDVQYNAETISCKIKIDGVGCDAPLHDKKRFQNTQRTYRSTGLDYTATHRKPYRFAALDKVDGCSEKMDTNQVKSLGTIEIQISHCNKKRKTSRRRAETTINSKSIDAISEQMLKGRSLSRTVKFEAPERKAGGADNYWATEKIGHPYIVRLFYRSEQDLKDMHVIARTPSPEPLHKRDFTSLSTAELQALHEEVRMLREQGMVVKREDERPAKRAKFTKVTLTLDDDGEFQEEEVALPSSGLPYALD